MKCRGYQLSCWILFLSIIAAVPSQDNELNTQKDSCFINEERQSLTCDSSVISTDTSAVYVPKETLCRHNVKDTCFVCQKGVLSQTKCPKNQRLRRQKRDLLSRILEYFINAFISFFDKEKPVFSNCPTKKINTIDKRFRWSVTATDNFGKVTIKQIQGNPPGSLLEYGAHLIKYQASDKAGHMAYCSFVVELKRTDCPRPSSHDTDIKFLCSDLTADSYCQLSCESGSMVKGSKYIKCEQDKSQNNTSTWQPVEGVEAYCQRISCPALNAPKNGALVCDKQLGGTSCQIQCNEDYDVAYSEQGNPTFFCGSNSGAWSPSNTAPDCLELAFPDEYYLPTEFFYYMGDCSDEVEMRKIKQQFIDNLNSIGISPCMTDVCSVDDVELSCGDAVKESEFEEFRRRRRRSTKKILHVRLTFRLKNSNRKMSPQAASSMLKSLAAKSKNFMSTNTAMRYMLFKSLDKPIFSPEGYQIMRLMAFPSEVRSKSVLGKLSMHCPEGSVQQSEVCVPCSAGTYASKDRCIPCGVNSYQDRPGSSLCQQCPLHHITFSTGAANRTACKELCKKDSFSLTGVEPCFPCPDGKYQMQYGGKTCTACPDSNPARRTIPKCSKRTSPANGTMASKFRISNFLLTCDSQVCLSF